MEPRGVAKLLAPLVRRVRLAAWRGVLRLTDSSKKMQTAQVSLLDGEVRDDMEHAEPYGFTSRPHDEAEAFGICIGGNRNHPVAMIIADRRFRLKNLAKGEVALYTDEGDYIHFKRGRKIEVLAGDEVKVTCAKAVVNASASIQATCATAEVTATTSAKVTSPLVTVEATTKVTVTSPLAEFSGAVTVAGLLSANGGLAAVPGAGGGPAVAVTGNVNVTGDVALQGGMGVTGGDVTVDGISAKTHVHPENNAPGGTTGAPQ